MWYLWCNFYFNSKSEELCEICQFRRKKIFLLILQCQLQATEKIKSPQITCPWHRTGERIVWAALWTEDSSMWILWFQLTDHILYKHNDNPGAQEGFDCDRCLSRYKEKKSLVAHQRLKHGTVKVEFPCAICGKVFKQKYNMLRHKRSHKDWNAWICMCLNKLLL